MYIIGFLGSPRTAGASATLLASALAGAESKGAKVKRYNLIDCNIMHCRGCGACFKNNPELVIGKCPLDDDVAAILEDYMQADGYVFASPVYDGNVTSIMKKFLERKIALTYKPKEDLGKISNPRRTADFKKKASHIVTGDAFDEYREVMGDPCFEAMEIHLFMEQIESVDKMYMGNAAGISAEDLEKRKQEAYAIGRRLVEEIEKAQNKT
jgi:multimeric flavodoxin WrbA